MAVTVVSRSGGKGLGVDFFITDLETEQQYENASFGDTEKSPLRPLVGRLCGHLG